MSLAVVVDCEPLPERALIASLLGHHAGLPPPVANKLAGRGRGIVWESAPDQPAQAVAAALTTSGFASRAIPQERVPPASAPRRVHVLALEGEHLGIQLRYSGPPEWIAWSDVLVLSAGTFRTETARVEAEAAMVVGQVVIDERVQVDITREIVLEVFARPLADRSRLMHFRLNSQEVNYAHSVGGTIHEGWREKFSLLVAKLGLRAETAVVSPQTEALLASGMQPQNCAVNPYFAHEEEFAAYNRWLLTRQLVQQ